MIVISFIVWFGEDDLFSEFVYIFVLFESLMCVLKFGIVDG